MSGAAAVVAAPAKKKIGAGKIVLIIAIVLAVLLGGAAAFFFTNKATALSIVMGKPKYAAMIEKESLKKVTDNLDLDVVSEQIKTVSGTLSTLASTNSIDIEDVLGLGSKANTSPEIAKLMAVSPMLDEGVDVKALLKGYSEYMQSVYGASRIYGSMSMNLSLGDDYMDDEISAILDIVNGAEISYDTASTDKLLGGEFGIKFNNKTVDARVILEDDGSAYILFPFATDKALKYKIPTAEGTSVTATADSGAVLELDSAEIERLINEIVDIYSDYIKKSSVTMEKGTMNVAGISIEGKQITADINGKTLENLFKDVFEHIANDKYFCGKIVEYIKNFDPDFTESDYTNGITDMVKNMSGLTESDKLIVTTIVNNSGKVLAKSYTVADNGMVDGSVAFADNDTMSAFEVKGYDQTIFTVTNEKTSEKDGTITVAVGIDSQSVLRIKLNYSGVGSAEFGKTQVPVGKYTLSFDTSALRGTSYFSQDELDMLKGFEVSLNSSVSGKTANYSFAISIRNVIDLDLSANMTLSDDVSKFKAPSNVIDLTAIINGEDLSDATMQILSDYIQELADGLENAFKGTELEDIFSNILQGSSAGTSYPVPDPDPVTPPSGNQYRDQLGVLEDRIWDEMMEVYDWFDDYDFSVGFENDPAYINAMDYQERLSDLDDRVWDAKYDDCTKEQFDALNKEFLDILAQKDEIKFAVINS